MGFLPGGSVRRALGAVFGGMFAACLAVACSASPGTGFLVRVSSQLPLAEIVLRVHDSQDRVVHCGKHAVNRAGVTTGIDLPASLGVIPEDPAATTDVRVVALAFTTANVSDPCAEGAVLAPRVRAEALVSYVPGSVLELPLPFSLSCLDVDCPGQVCRHGTCTDTRVDPKRLARLAEGDVDGTGCSRLSECGRSVVLAPTPDRCVFDLPAGEPVDRIVPFVTYDFGDGTLAASEFLDVADYELPEAHPAVPFPRRPVVRIRRPWLRTCGRWGVAVRRARRSPALLPRGSFQSSSEIDLDAGGASRDAGLDGACMTPRSTMAETLGLRPTITDGSGEATPAPATGRCPTVRRTGSGDSGGSGGDSGPTADR
ncbi:MAG: hypothetical protein U0169_27410 [Polyangiaceae bacterium]